MCCRLETDETGENKPVSKSYVHYGFFWMRSLESMKGSHFSTRAAQEAFNRNPGEDPEFGTGPRTGPENRKPRPDDLTLPRTLPRPVHTPFDSNWKPFFQLDPKPGFGTKHNSSYDVRRCGMWKIGDVAPRQVRPKALAEATGIIPT